MFRHLLIKILVNLLNSLKWNYKEIPEPGRKVIVKYYKSAGDNYEVTGHLKRGDFKNGHTLKSKIKKWAYA